MHDMEKPESQVKTDAAAEITRSLWKRCIEVLKGREDCLLKSKNPNYRNLVIERIFSADNDEVGALVKNDIDLRVSVDGPRLPGVFDKSAETKDYFFHTGNGGRVTVDIYKRVFNEKEQDLGLKMLKTEKTGQEELETLLEVINTSKEMLPDWEIPTEVNGFELPIKHLSLEEQGEAKQAAIGVWAEGMRRLGEEDLYEGIIYNESSNYSIIRIHSADSVHENMLGDANIDLGIEIQTNSILKDENSGGGRALLAKAVFLFDSISGSVIQEDYISFQDGESNIFYGWKATKRSEAEKKVLEGLLKTIRKSRKTQDRQRIASDSK